MINLIINSNTYLDIVAIASCILSFIQFFLWLNETLRTVPSILVSIVINLIMIFTVAPVVGVIALIFIITNTIKISKKFRKKNKNEEVKEISRNNIDSIYLESDKGTIEIANPYRGIIIQGGAGSGKSRSLFYPIIKQFIENDFSGILYDFKSPELSEFAYSFYSEKNKINFASLNFKSSANSVRLNPLSPKYLNKQAIAFEMATVLVNNLLPESIKKKDYWTRSSISVIAGAIWYLRNNYPQLCSLPHLIAMILSFPSVQLIEKLSSDIETAGMISSLKEAYEMKAEKQIAGVVGTIKNALAQLNIPEIFYLLSEDQINLELNNKDNPTFLVIGNDSTLSSTYAPIISLVISVCVRQMNQPGKHRSAIILDEAPTLFIPDFEQIPATARSNRVATVYGLQDYSQMVDKYGADKAQVMISNLGNQFFGRTVNEKTADMVVKLFGKHDVTYNSTSTSSGASSGGLLSGRFSENNSTSVAQSVQQRERVKVSEIINLSAGKFYGTIAEGNVKELIGVQLKQVPDQKREFMTNDNSISLNENFKKIYSEVEIIRQNDPGKKDTSDDFNIILT